MAARRLDVSDGTIKTRTDYLIVPKLMVLRHHRVNRIAKCTMTREVYVAYGMSLSFASSAKNLDLVNISTVLTQHVYSVISLTSYGALSRVLRIRTMMPSIRQPHKATHFTRRIAVA